MSTVKLLRDDPARRPVQIKDQPQAPGRSIRFIQSKLLLAVAGLIFYFSVLWPRLELFAILAFFIAIDLLFLIPYYYWTNRNPSAMVPATQLSLALSVLGLTVGLHLAGDFTQPTAISYSLLFPLVFLAIPSPRAMWTLASQVTVAYLLLIALEVSGLVPMIGTGKPNLQAWLVFAAMIVFGFWLFAILASRWIGASQTQLNKAMQLERDALRRAQAESIWSTVGKTVISTHDLDRVLTAVIQIIQEKMHVEAASVMLREPGTDEIVFAKILHGSTEQFAGIRLKVGQGIIGWVVSKGEPVIIQDVARDPRWYNGVDKSTGFKTHSAICVPLIATDEVIGAIELLNKQGGEFTESDLQLLESIAAPVAIAIQNARLHQRILSQLNDLTDLFRLVENAKKEWEATVDAIDQGIMVTDDTGHILRVNDTLAGWVHTPSHALAGQMCCQVIHGTDVPPSYCPHAQLMLAKDFVRDAEIEEPRLGGIFHATAYPLKEADGTHIGAVTVLKNVTEEKRMQARLIQSERLAATGRLAASLAHEINNPLQAIEGCLELAQAHPMAHEKQQRHLRMARMEVERLAKMVQGMLNFYRPSQDDHTSTNVANLLDNVLSLSAERLKHAHVTVQSTWDTDVPPVECVADQITQLFLNLILNAVDAMPEGGNLEIRGQLVEEGQWLTVDFVDHGDGISPNELDKVFEPFYTTRTNGTGLGLSICQNIVDRHGGRLTVSSTVGQGSTFTVWLPMQVSEDNKALS